MLNRVSELDFYGFVASHASDDINKLRLRYSKSRENANFPLDFALTQIEARKKCRKKLPSFLERREFLFPTLLSAEQASNEAVARFHASLIAEGSSLLDLTAGLGIDDMTFAKNRIDVIACEIDEIKCDTLRHNAEVMKLSDNLKIICDDSIHYLENSDKIYDVIYVDPARRDNKGQRVHALENCQPDVSTNMSMLMRHANRIFIKSSPLLDISLIIKTVEHLHHIYIVCFKGECKEVLIDIRKDDHFTGTTAIDLDWEGQISSFSTLSSEKSEIITRFAKLPQPSDYQYLYEPNAGVMKIGDMNALIAEFPKLEKADINTHLFLSNELYRNFPGRVLQIDAILDRKSLKALKGTKLNIVVRNHPLTPQEISKKYGIISGGSDFLYAFRFLSTPKILTATPINTSKP